MSTRYIYSAQFSNHPELGWFIGYSATNSTAKIANSMRYNASQTKTTKLSKLMPLLGPELIITIHEAIPKTDARARVAQLCTHFNTYAQLNEPPKAKKSKSRPCAECKKWFSCRSSLARHIKTMHVQSKPLLSKPTEYVMSP